MGFFNRDAEQEQQYYEEQEMMEQPKAQSSNSPYYQPMLMPSEKADLYDKIRPEDVIVTIKFLLMGFEWNEREARWTRNEELRDIALSEIGATQLATLLFPVSNKSVSISFLKDHEIRARTNYLIRTAMKMLLYNWESYGIKSTASIYFVKDIMFSIAFITLKQPENAGVRQFIQGTTQENRLVQVSPKKEGVLGAIFRR